MTSRSRWLLCCGLALAIAACGGHNSSSPPPTSTHPSPTPIPTQLAGYASNVGPIIRASIVEGKATIAKVKAGSVSTAGDTCSTAATDISNLQSNMSGLMPPSKVQSVVSQAQQGFKALIAGLDQCGIASDSRSSSSLSAAMSRAQTGVDDLVSAESAMAQWDPQLLPTVQPGAAPASQSVTATPQS